MHFACFIINSKVIALINASGTVDICRKKWFNYFHTDVIMHVPALWPHLWVNRPSYSARSCPQWSDVTLFPRHLSDLWVIKKMFHLGSCQTPNSSLTSTVIPDLSMWHKKRLMGQTPFLYCALSLLSISRGIPGGKRQIWFWAPQLNHNITDLCLNDVNT